MVYCGKISKACLPCRKRRLACDLRKDGCGQCTRAHLLCTGYRDVTAIRIQDQTTAVQHRVSRHTHATGLTVRTVKISVCHHARDMFYHDHVIGETKGYGFLAQYYSPTLGDEYLRSSINTVSLAYLGHRKHSQSARTEARQHYINAIRLLRMALQDRKLATKESVLLSVLLLDVYEKISERKPRHDEAWGSHIKGALSLVRLRRDQQQDQPDHLRMLERLSTNILISCAVSDSAIPNELIASQGIVTSPLKWRESQLMIEFAQLKRQAKFHLLSDDEIVRNALNLDTQFLQLYTHIPSSWQHMRVLVEIKSAHHYENHHFTYIEDHTGQMWNVLRLTRIMICELIISHGNSSLTTPGLDLDDPVLGYAINIISQLSRDICATVPQILTQPTAAENLLSCYRIIFPLYIAAQSFSAPEAMTQYAIRQLRFIADEHGIEGALVVAKVLESGEKRNPWEVYALLGSYAFVC
jgi:hypothetical protein